MKLLWDSHALLWFCGGNEALSTTARAAIEDPDNEKYVSHVSAWEVAIKTSLGKLKLKAPFEELFPGALIANGFATLPLDFRHCRELTKLPFHHRDPFDRALIAQARMEGMTLVSRDPQFPAYQVPVLW